MADPHQILKPEKWASASLGLLEGEHVLSGLVGRDAGAQYTGALGDTVNIKRPAILAGVVEALRDMDDRETYGGIQTEAIVERSISVKLDTHVYSAVDLTDAELSLDITEFGAQVLTPQVKAIATRIEYMVAQKFNGLPAEEVTGTSVESGFIRKQIVAMRKQLNSQNVPASGRVLAVGVDVEEHLLNDPQFVRADHSGQTSALRSAELGNVYGFRVVVAPTLEANRMVAFHPSAYTLTTRAPQVPGGAVAGESTAYKGVALRSIKDYDSKFAKDRSFLSTFAGIGETTDFPVTYNDAGVPTVGATAKMLRAVAATVTVEEAPFQ